MINKRLRSSLTNYFQITRFVPYAHKSEQKGITLPDQATRKKTACTKISEISH